MSDLKFDLKVKKQNREPGLPVIKVIGLGGGGGNAVEWMLKSGIEGVEFLCANTDAQALSHLSSPVKIQLGETGLGAGADPEKGKRAAEQELNTIKSYIEDADMVFITAGMGGGTGTGSAPVVAKAARDMGILTVGVVSRPFSFERRDLIAQEGIDKLKQHVDSLITIPNDRLVEVLGQDFKFAKAFEHANEVLHDSVQGISVLIIQPGIINVDFEDLRAVMSESGIGMMGIGEASGEGRAEKALRRAIENPLLDQKNISGARGLLVNITCGEDFSLGEYNEIGDIVYSMAKEDSKVIIGTSINPELGDLIRVTVVATGIEKVEPRPRAVTPNLHAVQAVSQAEAKKQENVAILDKQSDEPVSNSGFPINPAQELHRQKRAVNGSSAPEAPHSMNFLDIPAFLRRQAD
ncbi:MAG: cell division protein FtsZ [Methyloprofundus sp.]|nr:cell division protein FtsZ [Methyloprofundus sp.]